MNIPNVGFNHDKSNNAELEIIELSSLYERTSLSHDPEAPHRVRLDNGKIVEHWDTVEAIPEKTEWKNTNGKFGF